MASVQHKSGEDPQDEQRQHNMPINPLIFEELVGRRSFRVAIGNLHRCNILHAITKLVRHHVALMDKNGEPTQTVCNSSGCSHLCNTATNIVRGGQAID